MKYITMQQVEAAPMTRANYNKYRGWVIPANENPADEGYVIAYHKGEPDEHILWYPKAEFEAVSRPVDGMTFGMAIEALKRGEKVCRKGWNGKGMFLWLKPSTQIKAEWCKDDMLKRLIEENGGEMLGLGTVCMYTHDSTGRKAILTGWLASQSDMLCEDWMIVE